MSDSDADIHLTQPTSDIETSVQERMLEPLADSDAVDAKDVLDIEHFPKVRGWNPVEGNAKKGFI